MISKNLRGCNAFMLTTKVTLKRNAGDNAEYENEMQKGFALAGGNSLCAAHIKLGMLMLIKSRQVPRKVIFNKVAYLHKGKIMAVPPLPARFSHPGRTVGFKKT